MADVRDIPEESKFVIEVDGQRAGHLEYELRKGLIIAVHTDVDDSYEGQGLGGKLAEALLKSAGDAGLKVRPLCPFVKSYLERHPDYQDLLEGP